MADGGAPRHDRALPALQAALLRALKLAALSPEQSAFLSQAVADWGDDELAGWTAGDLAAAAKGLWAFAVEAKGKGPAIRVRAAEADDPAAHLIEIVQDDAPFLVASVMGEIAARGLSVQAMIHPVVEIDGRRRSLIQVAVAPFPDHAALVDALRETLADVTTAVGDFPAMTELLGRTLAELERSGRASDEDLAFLRWLEEGRFVLLGARLYDYPRTRDGGYAEDAPLSQPQGGLGILRDAGRLVLRRGDEPAVLSAALRDQIAHGDPVIVAKSNLKSRVHRRVHMDYVGVRRYGADGRPVGETRFVGLFTAEAYNQPVDQTPLIRRKAAEVRRRAGFEAGGHNAVRLKNILAAWPRDDLFQISEDELLVGALAALRLHDRPRVDLFVRRDPFDRFVSILLYVPRERYDYAIVQAAGQVLAEAYGGRLSAAYPEFDDAALARVHYIIGFGARARVEPDMEALRARLAELTRTWPDRFEQAARESATDEASLDLTLGFSHAFPPGYAAANDAAQALADVRELGRLSPRAPLAIRAFRRKGDAKSRLRFKLYARKAAPALADVAPILEHMGLKALQEESFVISPPGGTRAHIQEYLVQDRSGAKLDLAEAAAFEEAFIAVCGGQAESDGFNRLVLELGASWREAALIRALARYRQQSGLDPSQAVQEQAVDDHPGIVRLILDLFRTRFDPAIKAGREAREEQAGAIAAEIETALQAVPSLDADRALRRISALVQALVRINYYQVGKDGAPKPHISFKVASRALTDLPDPKPFREIFVSAAHVDGVHLRFGPVARGGLRWSDRRDDFRTEVLGLVKAQQVKNAVIVPVGSKGGFFPKRLPRGGSADAVREEAVRAYRTFLAGLLDLTDNLGPDGEIVHPADVVIHDADDPYLVVAADKGTATFSDIANGLAEDYGFWLGDAFASGGSAGYDHKKMGITARGAWEAVKRHFRELGKDIQKEAFTVAGVGDMSGDVFGNGMLLSRQIKLVAAFDHRHIFLDPDPDPEKSWVERARMFQLPRSSWDDYDKALISKGGGVFPRTAKSIPISPQVQALLDIKAEALPPAEVLTAILKARVELFYLGGIGAYVKAQGQTHAQAGDKLNDAIRVDGRDLRCKVVGEGANLGVTQAGRIEFALAGGRINTDAIDNSAGVDCSDHEVNIKILTGMLERAGKLTRPQRNRLLEAMTDGVASRVLRDNYDQTLALSLMEAEAAADLEAHERFILDLEAKGRLDRAVEGLPDATGFAARAKAGLGLTRPELAVLMAYGKLDLFDDLIESQGPDDPHFLGSLKAYFPDELGAFEPEMRRHRLRREIIATMIGNTIVNRCGPTFPARLRAAARCDTAALAVAFEAARTILDLEEIWSEVEALDGPSTAAAQIALFRELAYVLRGQTFWLARKLVHRPSDIAALVKTYCPAIRALRALGPGLLSPFERKAAARRAERFVKAGAPKALAEKVATSRPLTTASDLVDLADASGWPVASVARLYHHIGGALGFDRLRAAAGSLGAGDAFERTAVRRLVEEMLAEQTDITAALLGFTANPEAGDSDKAATAAVASWMALNREAARQATSTLEEVEGAEGGWSFAKLTIANAALRELAANPRRKT